MGVTRAMTQRVTFSKAEIEAAARVASERGVTVTLEKPDGSKMVFSPLGAAAPDPFDLVDVRR